jgi:hypothetical protein
LGRPIIARILYDRLNDFVYTLTIFRLEHRQSIAKRRWRMLGKSCELYGR